jgi:streptogramin lyase
MKRIMPRSLALSATLVICGMCAPTRADLFLVGDAGSSQIRKYDSSTGAYTAVTLPGPTSTFNTPFGLAFGPDSNFYFSSLGDRNVYKFNTSSTGFTSGGVFIPHDTGGLTYPNDIAFLPSKTDPAGFRVLVTSYTTNSIISYDSQGGTPTTFASGLHGPTGMVVDSTGNVFVSDSLTNSVIEIDKNGKQTTLASNLDHPAALALSGNFLFVANFANDQTFAGSSITRINVNNQKTLTFSEPGLTGPAGLAIGSSGNLFVTSYQTGQIYDFGTDGSFNSVSGPNPFFAGSHPTYIAAIPSTVTVQSAPEPTSLALTGIGLALILGYSRRRRSTQAA